MPWDLLRSGIYPDLVRIPSPLLADTAPRGKLTEKKQTDDLGKVLEEGCRGRLTRGEKSERSSSYFRRPGCAAPTVIFVDFALVVVILYADALLCSEVQCL